VDLAGIFNLRLPGLPLQVRLRPIEYLTICGGGVDTDASAATGGRSQGTSTRATGGKGAGDDTPGAGQAEVGKVEPAVGTPEQRRASAQQLRELEKKGKIEGFVGSLQRRLQSQDLDTVREAEAEFREVQQQVANGEKPYIEEYQQKARPQATGKKTISTGNKTELQDSAELKKLLPGPQDRQEFMDWLKSGHGQGEKGPEIPEGQTQTEEHGHFDPGSRELNEAVEEWRLSRGRTKTRWERETDDLD
jgi:hypothetical protein